ncbi:MAG: ABC transporter ATP-binding protein [Acidobacteriota bacterium]
MIEMTDVHKSYRDGTRTVEVLRGVDLRVDAGELVAIIGPSGSGKSTLLHLLGALDQPDRGTVRIAGREVRDVDPEALARFRNQTLGFVFQFHRLLPDFDALENVMLPGRIAGRPPRDVRGRAEALLERVGLSDRLDHFPSQLSGGERQRVALCRALSLEPAVLLADEPTGNLDPEASTQVFELLLELQRTTGTTCVLVTHDPDLAGRCGSLFELENGVLTAVDPAATSA